MSDCGVCLSYDESSCDFFIDEWDIVTSPDDHKCSECGTTVKAGERIERASVMRDGDEDLEGNEREPHDDDVWTCVICAEIADAFYCNGRMFGGTLWDSLYEVHEGLNHSCFNKLKTPEAKAELQRRWMKWKGLLPAPTKGSVTL